MIGPCDGFFYLQVEQAWRGPSKSYGNLIMMILIQIHVFIFKKIFVLANMIWDNQQ